MKGLVLLLITLGLAKSLSLDTEDTEVKPKSLSLDTEDTEVELDEENGGIRSGKYIIENVYTRRYLLQDGPPIEGNRGAEGGWKPGVKAPLVVGADSNYYGRAYWNIIPKGGGRYLIENVKTKRYLLQDGPAISGERGTVGAWLPCVYAPLVVGADKNYNSRAYWKIIPKGGGRFLIENVKKKRYLLQDGRPIAGKRGAEGGWLPGVKAPLVVGADDNYYDRAYWKLRFQNSD